ncbi:ASCH domain protein [Parvimonas sp. oral taxon 110 str. F0139]|nr:ASCH domain protein [Parvimonas sp. oral taxon 110 str. F0139]
MADELVDLVNKGIKTATTGAYDLYEEDEEIPKVGEYNIILDGSGEPICITITREVYILEYNLISSNHAFLEGEGDRSYEYWKKVHDEYFTEEFKNSGKEFYEQAPMVCEVFEKVY